jgi:plastocyanin
MGRFYLNGRHIMALIPLVALLIGCGGGSDVGSAMESSVGSQSSDRAQAPVQVVIDNFTFKPAEITIPAGTKVTWINHDDVPHTATSSAKPRQFDSGALDTDEQFSHVFTTPGTYDYFCAVHKHMTARVIVK